MIKISKDKEPTSWTKFRMTPGASYQATPELYESLMKEQGYICAYCMRRIPCRDGNSREDHRIDHIRCQANHSKLDQLDYNNMVVYCSGAINEDFHCDKSKKDKNISFTPFDDNFIDSIRYSSSDGKISSTNERWNKEINTTLNLNNSLLKENRLKVLYATIDYLGKERWTKSKLKKMLDNWSRKDEKGKFKPYCGIVIWFLNIKLRLMNQ